MAADLLHVHVEYLRRMVREDRIPAHRFPGGREIRFLRDELIAVGARPAGRRPLARAPRSKSRATATDLAGKVVVITGGNSGIGKETAAELAGMGAHVVIAARNPDEGRGRGEGDPGPPHAGDRVETMPIDLASFASVRDFADAFNAEHDRSTCS